MNIVAERVEFPGGVGEVSMRRLISRALATSAAGRVKLRFAHLIRALAGDPGPGDENWGIETTESFPGATGRRRESATPKCRGASCCPAR